LFGGFPEDKGKLGEANSTIAIGESTYGPGDLDQKNNKRKDSETGSIFKRARRGNYLVNSSSGI